MWGLYRQCPSQHLYLTFVDELFIVEGAIPDSPKFLAVNSHEGHGADHERFSHAIERDRVQADSTDNIPQNRPKEIRENSSDKVDIGGSGFVETVQVGHQQPREDDGGDRDPGAVEGVGGSQGGNLKLERVVYLDEERCRLLLEKNRRNYGCSHE